LAAFLTFLASGLTGGCIACFAIAWVCSQDNCQYGRTCNFVGQLVPKCLMLKGSACCITHSSVRAACRLHAWQHRQRSHVMCVRAHTWLEVPIAFPSAGLAICLPLLCRAPPCTPAIICHQTGRMKQITQTDCHQKSTCSGHSARGKQPFAVAWIQHAIVMTSQIHSVGQQR